MTDTDRPQDIGRSHARKRSGGTHDRALVERYYAAMRADLDDLLTRLQPVPQDQGLGMVAVPDKRPDLPERSRIWDLAIKLGRELGAQIEPELAPDGAPAIAPPRRPRGRVTY